MIQRKAVDVVVFMINDVAGQNVNPIKTQQIQSVNKTHFDTATDDTSLSGPCCVGVCALLCVRGRT